MDGRSPARSSAVKTNPAIRYGGKRWRDLQTATSRSLILPLIRFTMYSIHISNQQSVLRVDRPRLVKLAQAVLASERVRAADISVALVDDAGIHEINRKFLGHDYPTDVISFLLESDAPRMSPNRGHRSPRKDVKSPARSTRAPGRKLKLQAPNFNPICRGAGKTLEGEIIISVEMAVSMAADFDWRPVHEMSLYLVHGLLHLCGYDDQTPREQRTMRTREVEILAPWKIVPRYAA